MCTITDSLSCPALTLYRGGEVVDVNFHAQRLAGSGSLPLCRSGLKFSDPFEQRRLLLALQDICDGMPLRTLVLTEGSDRFEVVCMAFRAHAARSNGQAPAERVAVLVLLSPMRVATGVPASARLGFSTSKLTSAERRVARVAASGMSNAEMASTLGVSLNTLKTHLRRVYSKLDVKRQSELVLRLKRADAK